MGAQPSLKDAQVTLIDMKVAAVSAVLASLRRGVVAVTLSYPGPEPATRFVTAADIPALRAEILSLEARRFHRIERGVA